MLEKDELYATLNFHFLDPAKHGDWDLLIGYVEDVGLLTNEMRKFVAGVLRGEIRRPLRNRPATAATRLRHAKIAEYVYSQQKSGLTRTDAIKKAVEHCAVDARTIQRILSKYSKTPRNG